MKERQFERPAFPIRRKGILFRDQERVNELIKRERGTLDLGYLPWENYNSFAFGNGGILGTFIRVELTTQEEIDTFFQSKERTVVELGGPGHEMSYGLQKRYPGQIAQTVGVTLIDPQLGILDRHSLIEANLNVPFGKENSSYDEIKNRLGERRVDLVVSRMMGGLDYLSKDPYVLTRIVAQIYSDLLSTDGRMLLEIPQQLFPFMSEWINVIRQTQGINAKFAIPQTPGISGGGLLAIEKSPEGPAEMPLLDLDAIKRLYRKIADNSWQEDLRQFYYSEGN